MEKKEAVEIKEIKEALGRIVDACEKGGIAEKLVAYEFLRTARGIEIHGINYNNSFSIMDTETINKLMVAMEDRYSELEEKYLCVCVAKLGASQKAIDSMVKTLADNSQVSIAVDLARVGASQDAVDTIVERCIRDDNLLYAVIAAKLGASQKAIDELAKYSLKKENIEFADDIVKLGISQHLTDAFVALFKTLRG